MQGQIDAGVLEVRGDGSPWTQEYIGSAYRRGLINSYMAVRKEAGKLPGSREEFLRQAFSQPETTSKIQLLATRSFESLKDVSSTVASALNRELAGGLAEGRNPMDIASRMSERISTLSKSRAERIARTEVIHAHAEGQLDSFEKLGVEEVGILAEWSTAGDGRVCPLCRPLDEEVIKVSDARGLIPRHPNCRCAWIPADEEDANAKSLKKAIAKSLRKESGKSTWKGKKVAI